jgi:glycosyltransferase involved in cell wall biosynthesis
MNTPKVTVLTAARNAGAFIGETIANIQVQTFRDWEYLIVDDASEDNTRDVVEHYAARDRRIRLVVRDSRGGPFAAANSGLQEAQGEYIVRIDADDLSPGHRIERQLAYLESQPRYHACITPWQSFNSQGLIPGSVTRIPATPRGFKWYLILRSLASHSSFTIEREALLTIGGYRELPAAQDYRMMCELSRHEWLGVMPDVLSFVRRHEHRISRTSGDVQQQMAIEVLEEHLNELTGQVWPREEIDALWRVGQARVMPITKGIGLLDRWKSLWEGRGDLNSDDEKQLWFFFFYHKWKFLHANLRSQPLDAIRETGQMPISKLPQSAQSGLDYLLSVLEGKFGFRRAKLENLFCML